MCNLMNTLMVFKGLKGRHMLAMGAAHRMK